VSGMDPGTSPTVLQTSQLSTIESQLIQLEEQVELLEQENMKDKEEIVQLERVVEELKRKVSLLETGRGSDETETEIQRPLMAIGGYGTNSKLSSAEVLNSSCDFPLPEVRYGHISVTTADGKTLVCSGSGVPITYYTNSCLEFDYQSMSWKNHSHLLSEYRTFASAVTLPTGTYVLGGEYKHASSEFLATGSSEWTQGPDIPKAKPWTFQSCAAKLSDTEFVIIGGARGNGKQISVYNIISNEWRQWPSLKVGVSGHTCVGFGDKVLMAGGFEHREVYRDDEMELRVFPGGTTGRTLIFDSTTGSAREVASLKYPRYWAAMELFRGKPLILGGDMMRINNGEIWNIDTETWEDADINLNIVRKSFSLVTMAQEIECD